MLPSNKLKNIVLEILLEQKALNTITINLSDVNNDIADFLIITTGTSARHIITLKDKVSQKAKLEGATVLGFEGEKDANWVVLDLGNIIVHFFKQEVRDYYNLEKIWEINATKPTKATKATKPAKAAKTTPIAKIKSATSKKVAPTKKSTKTKK